MSAQLFQLCVCENGNPLKLFLNIQWKFYFKRTFFPKKQAFRWVSFHRLIMLKIVFEVASHRNNRFAVINNASWSSHQTQRVRINTNIPFFLFRILSLINNSFLSHPYSPTQLIHHQLLPFGRLFALQNRCNTIGWIALWRKRKLFEHERTKKHSLCKANARYDWLNRNKKKKETVCVWIVAQARQSFPFHEFSTCAANPLVKAWNEIIQSHDIFIFGLWGSS